MNNLKGYLETSSNNKDSTSSTLIDEHAKGKTFIGTGLCYGLFLSYLIKESPLFSVLFTIGLMSYYTNTYCFNQITQIVNQTWLPVYYTFKNTGFFTTFRDTLLVIVNLIFNMLTRILKKIYNKVITWDLLFGDDLVDNNLVMKVGKPIENMSNQKILEMEKKKNVSAFIQNVVSSQTSITSQNKEQTPVNREQTPVNREQTPVNKEQTPVNKEQTPVNKEQTPVNKETNNFQPSLIIHPTNTLQQSVNSTQTNFVSPLSFLIPNNNLSGYVDTKSTNK
jgi:hypothetical protein